MAQTTDPGPRQWGEEGSFETVLNWGFLESPNPRWAFSSLLERSEISEQTFSFSVCTRFGKLGTPGLRILLRIRMAECELGVAAVRPLYE